MPSYAVARFIFSLLTFFGWLVCAGSIVVAVLLVVDGSAGLPALFPAIGAVFAGLVTVAAGQIGQAQIAVAMNTAEMAELLHLLVNAGKNDD